MSVLQNFRSAFNGFNREDVVKYIEYINAKHAALVNQLTSETEFLKEKLNAMSAAPAVSEAQKQADAERDTLKQQVAQLEERILMLELELEEAKAAKPAPEAPKPAVPSQPSITAVDVKDGEFLFTAVVFVKPEVTLKDYKGIEAELGVMGRFGIFALSAGVQTNSFKYMEFNVGVGVMF